MSYKQWEPHREVVLGIVNKKMLFLTHFRLHIHLVLRLIWKHFILMEENIWNCVRCDLGGLGHYWVQPLLQIVEYSWLV